MHLKTDWKVGGKIREIRQQTVNQFQKPYIKVAIVLEGEKINIKYYLKYYG